MDEQLHYLLALEIVRDRTREAEARARLRWGMEPEPAFGRRIAAGLANLGRALSRGALNHEEEPGTLGRSATPSGTAPA